MQMNKIIHTEYGDVKIMFSVRYNKPEFVLIVPRSITGERYRDFNRQYHNVIQRFKKECMDEMQEYRERNI